MSTLEEWVLGIADSPRTWFGLEWLRPAKERRVGAVYVLVSSFLLGLPGLAIGAGSLYLLFGRLEEDLWLWMLTLVFITELVLHLVLAHYWNRRAACLSQQAS